jgi:hypothetical protein
MVEAVYSDPDGNVPYSGQFDHIFKIANSRLTTTDKIIDSAGDFLTKNFQK